MKLTRAVDEQLSTLYRQGRLVGGCYSSRGQEATSVGSAFALEAEDYIGPMIRNVGAVLVKGFRPRDVFMQYMGKAGSPTGGKDGTAHYGDVHGRHVIAPISHLGSLVPVLTGIGMALQWMGRKSVCLTWIGDGGAQVGEVHEGLNFAAVRRAPLILIVENNKWAYSTPVEKECAVINLADRAQGYGIPGVIVDGNDVLAVYEATKQAVDRARAGEGPTLIEAKTMRMKGHAEHDSASYVPSEMIEEWSAKDPIVRFEKYLGDTGDVDERIQTEIREEVEAALASPMPDGKLALEGVFCDGCHDVPKPERVQSSKFKVQS